MKTYRVCLTRVEHCIKWIEIEASDESEANDKAHDELMAGIDFSDGEIVHADEFVNDIEEN